MYQPSERCLAAIKLWEGCRLEVYLDMVGVATIGFGHRLLATEAFPDGVTPDQANALFLADIAQTVNAITRLVFIALTQGQVDALTSFVFNLGSGRLAESTLLKDLNVGNYAAAGEQLLLWDHAGGQVVAGLKARREAEYAWWMEAAAI